MEADKLATVSWVCPMNGATVSNWRLNSLVVIFRERASAAFQECCLRLRWAMEGSDPREILLASTFHAEERVIAARVCGSQKRRSEKLHYIVRRTQRE